MADSVKIQVTHANFYYGGHQALFDVSVKIRPRFVTALIGPSGCGKSTFLRSLNRMNDLIPGARLEGKVEMDGENIYSDQTDVINLRRRVGMIFQRSNPFPMSVYDNVAYGVRINGLAKRRVQLD
jgi:phosphate transport system ATP-binding protein